MTRFRGFTLIELLVVISIIVLLISITLPSLANSKEAARDVQCRTQIRQVMLAFVTFSDDKKGVLPASWYEGPEMWQKAWAGTEVGTRGTSGAFAGSILSYVNGEAAARELYRCPSLPVLGGWGTGQGSNGRFDYSSFTSFSGAKYSLVPLEADWTDPATGSIERAPTPVIVEESPVNHINSCCIEAGHGSSDQQATTHKNGSNYAAIDTSSHRQIYTGRGPNCYEWTARYPSGVVGILIDAAFGGWNSR